MLYRLFVSQDLISAPLVDGWRLRARYPLAQSIKGRKNVYMYKKKKKKMNKSIDDGHKTTKKKKKTIVLLIDGHMFWIIISQWCSGGLSKIKTHLKPYRKKYIILYTIAAAVNVIKTVRYYNIIAVYGQIKPSRWILTGTSYQILFLFSLYPWNILKPGTVGLGIIKKPIIIFKSVLIKETKKL